VEHVTLFVLGKQGDEAGYRFDFRRHVQSESGVFSTRKQDAQYQETTSHLVSG
jgi:hypothetical protein